MDFMPTFPGQGTPLPPPPPGLLGALPQIDPQRQGLLAAAFQGLQASGPSRTPVSFGQTLGQAGQAGMQAQRQAQNDQLHQQQVGMQSQMQQMQMQEHLQKLEQQKRVQQLAPLFTNPAASMLFQAGDIKGAVERQDPKKEYEIKQIANPDGTPGLAWVPKTPGGQITPMGGAVTYSEKLDPRIRVADINDAVAKEKGLAPIRIDTAIQSGAPGRDVQIRGQDISRDTAVRGQNMTDTRARDANVIAASGTAVKTESGIRDDYRKDSQDFVKVRDAHQRVLASAKDPSAAGDLALIFNYMKVLDPGSTVREGEFATAQNSGGIDDRIRAQYNKVISGTRLAPNVRADFVDRSGRLYGDAETNQKKIEEQYRGITTRSGGNPNNVVMPQRVESSLAPSKTFQIEGKGVIGKLDPSTQKYIVIKNGKKFYVEE